MNNAVIGNNCNYSAAGCSVSVSEPQGKRDGNRRKIDIDIALKNQYRFETESRSLLKLVDIVVQVFEHWLQ